MESLWGTEPPRQVLGDSQASIEVAHPTSVEHLSELSHCSGIVLTQRSLNFRTTEQREPEMYRILPGRSENAVVQPHCFIHIPMDSQPFRSLFPDRRLRERRPTGCSTECLDLVVSRLVDRRIAGQPCSRQPHGQRRYLACGKSIASKEGVRLVEVPQRANGIIVINCEVKRVANAPTRPSEPPQVRRHLRRAHRGRVGHSRGHPTMCR